MISEDTPMGAAPAPPPMPAALATLPESACVHLDVRDDIRRRQEPFARIMAAVNALGTGQALVLRTPFEPVPLYDRLARRGFAHWAERGEDGSWSVWFYRDAAGTGAAPGGPAAPPPRVLDVRGLEPPQPMALVLDAMERLEPGRRLEVIHDRRPLFLYPLIEARGLTHATEEPEPGVVRIVIERRGAG